MLRITREHVGLKRRELFVPTGKNNKARTIVLSQAAVEIIAERLEKTSKDGLLFSLIPARFRLSWAIARSRTRLSTTRWPTSGSETSGANEEPTKKKKKKKKKKKRKQEDTELSPDRFKDFWRDFAITSENSSRPNRIHLHLRGTCNHSHHSRRALKRTRRSNRRARSRYRQARSRHSIRRLGSRHSSRNLDT